MIYEVLSAETDPEEYLRRILMMEGIEDEEVLANTPRRWCAALREQLDVKEFEFTTFESAASAMVIEKDIHFSSMCAHHLLPFYGVAHVGYIPSGRLAGLSKLARAVRFWAKGLWAQEDLVEEIADHLDRSLHEPLGVAVVLEAQHTCMTVRGVRAPGATTITSAMRGVFLDNVNNARSEFLSLIK